MSENIDTPASTVTDPAASRHEGAAAARTAARGLDLAVIGGDGIGPEVTAQALRILQAALAAEGRPVAEVTDYALGADHYTATGQTLTDEQLAALRRHDAILFGAVGARTTVQCHRG